VQGADPLLLGCCELVASHDQEVHVRVDVARLQCERSLEVHAHDGVLQGEAHLFIQRDQNGAEKPSLRSVQLPFKAGVQLVVVTNGHAVKKTSPVVRAQRGFLDRRCLDCAQRGMDGLRAKRRPSEHNKVLPGGTLPPLSCGDPTADHH